MVNIRLSSTAESDIIHILAQTYEMFGHDAQARYQLLLVTALRDLGENCRRHGVLSRPELGADIFSYHLRHSRDRARHETGVVRRPRHLILFRQVSDSMIGVGRVLHDVMELARHLPADFGSE